MNRRKFLQGSAASLAATGLLSNMPFSSFAQGFGAVNMPIGFQSYVLRDEIGKDPTGTMKRMASYGYQTVEMCSPSGYQGPFAPLAKYSGKELKKIVEDTGLKCPSAHFTWDELMKNLDERIDFAQQMGMKHMVCSGGLIAPTLDAVKKKCELMNKVGEKVKAGGMVAGYHNHNGEFEEKLNGRPQYDIMMEELDGSLVKMQFQVAAIQVGYKAADYFRKFPGCFISAHLQDYSSADKEKQVVLGQGGIVDWKDFFAAAKAGGLHYVYVEMESDPGTLEGSVKYLKNL